MRVWERKHELETAMDAYELAIEACRRVAEFENCEDAADWKDAHNRLTQACRAAVRQHDAEIETLKRQLEQR